MRDNASRASAVRQWLLLAAGSTKMFVRSPDVLLGAALVPVAYVGLTQLLGSLRFVVHASSVGVTAFIAVGVATGMVALVNEHTTVAAAAAWKATGTLKRISVTPLRPAAFIAAHAAPRLLAALIEAVMVLAAVRALGVNVHLGMQLLAALPLILAMTAIVLGLAFAIAGYARTAQGANQLDTFIAAPLMLLSGVLYPVSAFPLWLQRLSEYAVPYTSPLEALRGIVGGGHGIGQYPRQLAVTAAWLVAALALAARGYRFSQE